MADVGFTVKIDEALTGEVLASHVAATMEWSDNPDPAIDDRIGDETLQRGGGIAWETFRKRLKTFGQPAG